MPSESTEKEKCQYLFLEKKILFSQFLAIQASLFCQHLKKKKKKMEKMGVGYGFKFGFLKKNVQESSWTKG